MDRRGASQARPCAPRRRPPARQQAWLPARLIARLPAGSAACQLVRLTPRLLLAAALLLSSTGCARLFGTYDFAPNGLAAREDRLRTMLASGQAGVAFAGFGSSYHAPDDEVLRAMYQGMIAFHAGDYGESARLLDIAGPLADDRITKSISRSALSVVSNDLILPYEPGRTERLMIPYYAALARLRMGDIDGAAVEARRLSMLLQYYGDDDEPLDEALEATLRYVAGAIFEVYGDRSDSNVAYRNAIALDSSFATPGPAPIDGYGTVIVILEQGFVAHRVEQGLSMLLLPEEVDLIANGESDERSTALGFVAARTLAQAASQPLFLNGTYRPPTLHVPAPEDRSHVPRRRPRVVCRTVTDSTSTSSGTTTSQREVCAEEEPEIDELPYLLKVAWPVYRSEYRPQAARLHLGTVTVDAGAVTPDSPAMAGEAPGARESPDASHRVRDAGPADRSYRTGKAHTPGAGNAPGVTATGRMAGAAITFAGNADLSRGVVADFQAERALVIARTVARGAAKLALTKGAEKKLEEKNEAAGKLIGLLGNIGNALLERADTRSWHLLPAGIAVARVQLPPGEHRLQVEIGARTVELEPVPITAGGVTILTKRIWR
ncbi:MAG TPA: hypothetical protein VK912_02400 [Longimicrobiales bacterium]|nr:hypothetical protein [Longimicrobiales bacterium]